MGDFRKNYYSRIGLRSIDNDAFIDSIFVNRSVSSTQSALVDYLQRKSLPQSRRSRVWTVLLGLATHGCPTDTPDDLETSDFMQSVYAQMYTDTMRCVTALCSSSCARLHFTGTSFAARCYMGWLLEQFPMHHVLTAWSNSADKYHRSLIDAVRSVGWSDEGQDNEWMVFHVCCRLWSMQHHCLGVWNTHIVPAVCTTLTYTSPTLARHLSRPQTSSELTQSLSAVTRTWFHRFFIDILSDIVVLEFLEKFIAFPDRAIVAFVCAALTCCAEALTHCCTSLALHTRLTDLGCSAVAARFSMSDVIAALAHAPHVDSEA